MDFTKYDNTFSFPPVSQSISLEKRRQMLKEYRAESKRLNDLFTHDALKDVGLKNHPNKDKIFDYAWERGHSCGLEEIYIELCELADLF